MATDKVLLRDTKRAAFEGFEPSKQFFLVEITESDTLELAVSGSAFVGVLLDTPKTNEKATFALLGITKVVCAAEIKEGQLVASNGKGEAQVAVTGQFPIGRALEKANGAGSIIAIQLTAGTGVKL